MGQSLLSPTRQIPLKQPQNSQNLPGEPSQAPRALPTQGHSIVTPVVLVALSLPEAARPVGLDLILFGGFLVGFFFPPVPKSIPPAPVTQEKRGCCCAVSGHWGELGFVAFLGSLFRLEPLGHNLVRTPNLDHLIPKDKISDSGQSASQLRTSDKVTDKEIIK